MKNSKGFTIIEILVVLVILGILGTLLVPKLLDKPDEARMTKAKLDMKAVEAALKIYKLENSIYPTTEQGLQALVKETTIDPIPTSFKKGGYIDEVPKDPWGGEYVYRSPGDEDRDYEIICYGADRKEGGEGVNADIKSFNDSEE